MSTGINDGTSCIAIKNKAINLWFLCEERSAVGMEGIDAINVFSSSVFYFMSFTANMQEDAIEKCMPLH